MGAKTHVNSKLNRVLPDYGFAPDPLHYTQRPFGVMLLNLVNGSVIIFLHKLRYFR